MQISEQKLVEEALEEVGIRHGDIVLVHSDSTAIREFTGLMWGEALNLLKECFLNVLGESGTLIVPTFNWDFCKGKPYSHERTRSQVGMFTNNVLFDERSIRSFHPIYSFAAIGPATRDLFSNISKSSFGENSVFHRLHKINAKIIFFNVSFEKCTFLHYVEQSKGISYRFLKQFTGNVTIGDKEYIDSYDFYARYLDRDIHPYFKRLSDKLLSIKKINESTLNGKYPILLSRCDDIFNYGMKGMESDPYYLIENPPKHSIKDLKND
jgi:aminoglycoside 3-N-acetyltransferase